MLNNIKQYFSNSCNLNMLFKLWVSLFFLFVIFSKLPNIPQRTHELAALMYGLNCDNCGLGHVTNSLISSPVYFFLKSFFMTLKGYLIIQCLFLMISLIVFYKAFKGLAISKNDSNVAKVSLILIAIILLTNFIGGHWSNVAEYLGIGVNFLNFNFSARSILSLCYLFSCYFLIKKRIILSGIFIFIGMLSHPTNGVIIFLSMLGLILFNTYKNLGLKFNDSKKIIFFLMLGFVPIIVKLLNLEETINAFPVKEVSTFEYIASMYRDEIDDFSAIFVLYSSKIVLIASLLFSLTPLIISYLLKSKIKDIKRVKILSILIITPLTIFFIILFFELIYNSYGSFEFFIEKIINSQLGCRILKYSGIPAVIIYMILIKEFLNANTINQGKITNYLNLICFSSFTLITIFYINNFEKSNFNSFLNIISSESKSFSEYGRMSYYEDLLDAGYKKSLINDRFFYDCKCGNIYTEVDDKKIADSKKTVFKKAEEFQEKINLNFKHENYFNRKNIILKIKEKLKEGSKIITPPYLYCFREFLPKYDIYFQEHDDGNFMLGSRKIYERFKPRMNSLSFSYESLPSQLSGLMTTEIRNDWLKLNENNFKSIRSQGFEYVITEGTHIINLEILHKESDWIIYKIN